MQDLFIGVGVVMFLLSALTCLLFGAAAFQDAHKKSASKVGYVAGSTFFLSAGVLTSLTLGELWRFGYWVVERPLLPLVVIGGSSVVLLLSRFVRQRHQIRHCPDCDASLVHHHD